MEELHIYDVKSVEATKETLEATYISPDQQSSARKFRMFFCWAAVWQLQVGAKLCNDRKGNCLSPRWHYRGSVTSMTWACMKPGRQLRQFVLKTSDVTANQGKNPNTLLIRKRNISRLKDLRRPFSALILDKIDVYEYGTIGTSSGNEECLFSVQHLATGDMYFTLDRRIGPSINPSKDGIEYWNKHILRNKKFV